MSTATVAMLTVPPESRGRLVTSAAPLRWLDEDAIVHRAIGAKRSQPPAPHFWPRLAVLAQVCLAVARAEQTGADSRLIRTGERLATSLAAQLPAPGPMPHDPRLGSPSWPALRRGGLPVGDIADCAHDLAVTLADPHTPHLEDLADLVDDTLIVFDVYRKTARALRCERNRRRRTATSCDERGPP
jgi:hypothetical protein